MLPALSLRPLSEGQEIEFELEPGRSCLIKMVAIPPPDSNGVRQVIMELNGERWFVPITDNSVVSDVQRREKASGEGEIGSPMPGVVVDVKVKKGDVVKEGDQIAVLSAMKMETVVAAPVGGKVSQVLVKSGDDVQAGDLLVSLD